MSIRPVSRCFPSSEELLISTGLPLCVVMSPCEDITDKNQDDDDDDEPYAHPMTVVPKCLHCGAPHPTSTTHFRSSRLSSRILCYLCGETSSTMITDQQSLRDDEDLDPNTYDKISYKAPTSETTDTIEFRVPLLQPKGLEPIWQVPAVLCPPVWWIMVDGTVSGNAASKNYWTTVGATLSAVLEEIPPHVHVGLLTATGTRLANWDLTSAVPKVQQYPYSYDPNANLSEDDDHRTWDFCLVPATGHYKANLLAAIRAMVDGAGSGLFLDVDEDKTKYSTDGSHIPLGLTLEILADFMEQAHHPGKESEDNDEPAKVQYAGGKILCLLGNPPLETSIPPSDDSPSYMGQPKFGSGGVAGVCFAEADDDDFKSKTTHASSKVTRRSRFSTLFGTDKDANTKDTDPTDMTPSNIGKYTVRLEPDDMFVSVGRRCAEAALGVDLIVLVPEKDNDYARDFRYPIPWYGLPLLRPLSDSSGAPGPLMFGTANIDKILEGDEDSGDFDRLNENILARTPWQAGMVFGAQMRLRVSPGYHLELSSLGKGKHNDIELASYLGSSGLMGPATVLEEEESDEEGGGAWMMGTCDPYTSFICEIETESEVPDAAEMEGHGEVKLKPVLQTCTMYTCVETDDDDENPVYYTVSKIRVSSVALECSDETEAIFNGVDTDALAVSMAQKLALDAYVDGFNSSQEIAEVWLETVLKGLYASAEEEMDAADNEKDVEFVLSDRLLVDDEGELDETEVLMGQGHEKINAVPAMIYGLMNCDALRPSGKGFHPSMDARLCALAQLTSMTPTSLSTSIIPKLSLWSIDKDEPLLENLPLCRKWLLNEIEDLKDMKGNVVFLMESPQRVIVFRPTALQGGNGHKEKSDVVRRLGPKLQSNLLGAISKYRTPPPNWEALEDFANRGGDLNKLGFSPSLLDSALLEDMSTAGGDRNFSRWQSKLAERILEEMENDEKKKSSGGILGMIPFRK